MLSTLKPFEELDFTDDFIFYQVMQNDEICMTILEHLLKVRLDHIERQEVQKELKPYYESRGVRLDAYVKDSSRIFNVEMQKVSNDELPKRSRYYSSMIDASDLLKGVDYTNLSETFIIFLCKEDPFEKGMPVYTFKTTCQEDKDFVLNDEVYKIFFNAAAAENEKDLDIQSILNYIKCKEATDELTDKIATLIEEIKNREQNKEAYMIEHLKVRDNIMEGLREGRIEGRKLGLQEGRQEGIKEGIKEGRQKGIKEGIEEGFHKKAIEDAKKLLADGKYTAPEISKLLNIPVEDFAEAN